jgi:hypothetical protein
MFFVSLLVEIGEVADSSRFSAQLKKVATPALSAIADATKGPAKRGMAWIWQGVRKAFTKGDAVPAAKPEVAGEITEGSKGAAALGFTVTMASVSRCIQKRELTADSDSRLYTT